MRELIFFLEEVETTKRGPRPLRSFKPPSFSLPLPPLSPKQKQNSISRADMRDAVAAIFADRANLASTLVDARGVVRSLRSLLGGVVHAACCFLYLAIWDVSRHFLLFSTRFACFCGGVLLSLKIQK